MYSELHVFMILRAAGHTDKKADQEINQRTACAAHGRKGFLSHKVADDNGIGRIVQLLKKRAQQNGQKKQQHIFPDNALCDRGGCFGAHSHK